MQSRARVVTFRSPVPLLHRERPLGLSDYIVLVICSLLVPSAVVHGLVGVDERAAFAVLVPILIFISLIVMKSRVGEVIPLLMILILLIGALGSFVAESFSQVLMGGSLAAAVVGGQLLFLTLQKQRALHVLTVFTLLLLIGGVAGFFYAALGGQPLFEVAVGYRHTSLYLTTFSFATVGDFIRPSGVFDEPGAFAMFVGIVTIFNDVLKKNLRLNYALVFLMICTGSLAGFVLSILYFLTSNGARRYRKNAVVVLATLAAAIVLIQTAFPSNVVGKAFETFYADRMRIEDGRLVGDNRSNQIADFFELVDDELLLRGEKASEKAYDTRDMSSNPFSITYGYGLIVSLPYFALLAWLLLTAFSGKPGIAYACLGLLLLLLQRPYLYHMSWSILICATVFLIHYSLRADVPKPSRTSRLRPKTLRAF